MIFNSLYENVKSQSVSTRFLKIKKNIQEKKRLGKNNMNRKEKN